MIKVVQKKKYNSSSPKEKDNLTITWWVLEPYTLHIYSENTHWMNEGLKTKEQILLW